MRRTIESRLFDAVLIVLATAGCKPPPVHTTTVTQPDGSTNVVLANPADAERICKQYKESSSIAESQAIAKPMREWEGAYWNPQRGVAECTIRRSSFEGQVEVIHTPTCCRRGPTEGPPCPGPTKQMVPGTKYLMEKVDVKPDGTASNRVVGWATVEAEPEPRHNCGRRPEGLHLDGACADPADIGGQLAAMAELEAASVPAFERLARELAAHRAPAALVRRARAAMRDEVRHARVMSRLAARHGGTPRPIEVPALPIRTLDAIARENAIEGCVREAYGALVATYQAETAAPELREVFRAIAADERRHAALSEDVHAWILERLLDRSVREDVEAARAAAEHELVASLMSSPGCAALGIPGGAQAVTLFEAYFGGSN